MTIFPKAEAVKKILTELYTIEEKKKQEEEVSNCEVVECPL